MRLHDGRRRRRTRARRMPCHACVTPPPTTTTTTPRPWRGAGRIAGGRSRRAAVCFKWPGRVVRGIYGGPDRVCVDPTVVVFFCPRLRVWCTRTRTYVQYRRTCVKETNDEYSVLGHCYGCASVPAVVVLNEFFFCAYRGSSNINSEWTTEGPGVRQAIGNNFKLRRRRRRCVCTLGHHRHGCYCC